MSMSLNIVLLKEILLKRVVTDLVSYPVSKQVNAVRQNDPANIKPVQLEFEAPLLHHVLSRQ